MRARDFALFSESASAFKFSPVAVFLIATGEGRRTSPRAVYRRPVFVDRWNCVALNFAVL